MVSDILLKMALDRGIKSAAKYLKERQLKIDTTALEVEGAVSDHIKQVVNWSSEINFKDLPNAKLTMRVFVDLEILLMPIKNTLDDSETQKKIPSKQIFTNTTSHVAVLGQPGAGKTTLMKFICQSVLHDESRGSGRGDKVLSCIKDSKRNQALLLHKTESQPLECKVM
jgi:Cdc6-like AAA superfamily ATPase